MTVREMKSLTYTVPAATLITREDNYIVLDYDCIVRRVLIYFPPGCEDLVTVTVGAGDTTFLSGIVSGDGKSIVAEPMAEVKAKTPIWAEIKNEDTTYSHTPTIEIEVEKIREVRLV